MNGDHPVIDIMKHTADMGSAAIVLAAWAAWLPSVATLLSIIWFCLRIWESETVREWTGREKGE